MSFWGRFVLLCSLLLISRPAVAGYLFDPDADPRLMIGLLIWDSRKELLRCDSEEKAMWEHDVQCSDAIVAVLPPGHWVQKLNLSDDGRFVKVKVVSNDMGYKGVIGWVRKKNYTPLKPPRPPKKRWKDRH